MVKFDIAPEKTALLVIDMQNAFLMAGRPNEVPRGRDLIPNLNRLISACREKGILVIFTVHALREYAGDIGLWAEFNPVVASRATLMDNTEDCRIYDEIDYTENDVLIPKRAYSAFYGTELEYVLHIKRIDTLMISGVVTPLCCESTARDARHRNYKVIFLSDGTATYESLPDMGWGEVSSEEVQRVVLTILAYRFAEVASIRQVLQRLS